MTLHEFRLAENRHELATVSVGNTIVLNSSGLRILRKECL